MKPPKEPPVDAAATAGDSVSKGRCEGCTKLVTFVPSAVVGLICSRDPLSYLRKEKKEVKAEKLANNIKKHS